MSRFKPRTPGKNSLETILCSSYCIGQKALGGDLYLQSVLCLSAFFTAESPFFPFIIDKYFMGTSSETMPISCSLLRLYPSALAFVANSHLNQLPLWWLSDGDFSVSIIPSYLLLLYHKKDFPFFSVYLFILYGLMGSSISNRLQPIEYHCIFWC